MTEPAIVWRSCSTEIKLTESMAGSRMIAATNLHLLVDSSTEKSSIFEPVYRVR